jgi:hypothetical protein
VRSRARVTQAAGGISIVVWAGGIFAALLGLLYAAAAQGADDAITLRIVSVPSFEVPTQPARPSTEEAIPDGRDVPEDIAAMLEAEREPEAEIASTDARPAESTIEVAATRSAPGMQPRRAGAQRSGRPPPVTVPRLHPDPGRHVVATARAMIARGEAINGSCHRYLSEVFERAGHGSWRTRRIVYRGGRNGPYADLDLIRPGDWLYIVNHPNRDPVGTHSVLFVSWEDRARGHARVIEHPGWGAATTGQERWYDVSRTYRITRPVL